MAGEERKGGEGLKRRMGIFFLIVLSLFAFFYGWLIFLAASGSRFYLFWFFLSVSFLFLEELIRHGIWRRFPLLRGTCLLGIFTGLLFLLVSWSLIGTEFFSRGEEKLDYLVVLGAQVRPSGPAAVLRLRLDRAFAYLSENPETLCIVSGGKGQNEPCSEAEAMRDYLLRRGISAERILLEDQSKNTRENIANSARLLNPERDRVGILSSDFHVYRGKAIAKKAGYREVFAVSARSNRLYLLNNMLRESLALVKDKIAGNL